jgi:type IV pilus assembly protein PilV
MHATVIHRQQGFGLVESLVALVVVSVGMIGIAVLYGQGLSASRTAFYRTEAVNLVSDMADRIRLNRRAGASYADAGDDNDCDPSGNVDCTIAEMAAQDIFEWQAQVEGRLPGGEGVVEYDGTTPATYTISVTWQEVGVGALTHQIAVRIPTL